MRIATLPLLALAMTAGAAYAQDAAPPASDPSAELPAEAAPPAEAATPAEPAADAASEATSDAATAAGEAPAATASANAEITDAQVDSFAAAAVKVRALNADSALAADEKQAQAQAIVSASGLDAETYNKIAGALATDSDLRTRVQAALGRQQGPSES